MENFLNKLFQTIVFGHLQMGKFKIIRENIFKFLFRNGKINGIGGKLPLKGIQKLIQQKFNLKVLI